MTTVTLVPGDRIHDDEALLAFATQLGRELDDGKRTLALAWLDADDHLLPVVVPIDDIPEVPDDEFAPGLAMVMGAAVEEHAPGGSVVLILIRGGSTTVTAADRAWNRMLCSQDSARVRAVFVAAGGTVRPLPPDDVA